MDTAEAVDEHGTLFGSQITGRRCAAVGMNPGAVAVCPFLALPDRRLALDPFHQPLRRGEGLAAMRGARGDGHARFTDRDLAEPVDDRAGSQAVLRHRLVPQPGQHGRGQRFVGLVDELRGDLIGEHAGRHATRGAGEQHVRSGRIICHRIEQAGRVDRLPDQERCNRFACGIRARGGHVILRSPGE